MTINNNNLLNFENIELKKKLKKLNDDYIKNNQKLENKNKNYKEENSKLNIENTNLKAENSNLNAENTTLKTENNTLKKTTVNDYKNKLEEIQKPLFDKKNYLIDKIDKINTKITTPKIKTSTIKTSTIKTNLSSLKNDLNILDYKSISDEKLIKIENDIKKQEDDFNNLFKKDFNNLSLNYKYIQLIYKCNDNKYNIKYNKINDNIHIPNYDFIVSLINRYNHLIKNNIDNIDNILIEHPLINDSFITNYYKIIQIKNLNNIGNSDLQKINEFIKYYKNKIEQTLYFNLSDYKLINSYIDNNKITELKNMLTNRKDIISHYLLEVLE